MARLPTFFLVLIGAVAVASGIAWRFAAPQDEREEAAPPEPDLTASPPATPPASPAGALPAETAQEQEAPDAAALAAYESRLSVQGEISAFLEEADRLRADEKEAHAEALAARVRDLEEAGYLLGAQSFYLQAALASAQFSGDEAARQAALAALRADYEGAAPSTRHLDEKFQRYKAREREIVADAMAREVFPDGLTRNDYLRRELDTALREAYGPERDD